VLIDDERKIPMDRLRRTSYGNVRFGEHFLNLVFMWRPDSVNRFKNFRVLMSIDRWASSFSGRPCGLQDEEYVRTPKIQHSR
jgi:hypothetical protein